jgi:DNA-directed RNA polymerase subunit RPC12/RpoP
MESWKRKVAEFGLTVAGVEFNGNGTYLTLNGRDAERAKEFLLGESVDRELYYIVAETPDGVWGIDIEGLYLENLRPWQLETTSVDCRVPAGGIAGSPDSVQMAMRGSHNNFLVWVGCGRCSHRWIDGVRYQNETLTRCPECGARNLVDSSNIRMYVVDEPRSVSPLSSGFSAKPDYSATEERRAQVAARLAELIDANQQHFAGLTEEQKSLASNWRQLDAIISGAVTGWESPPGWLARVIEIRSIGHQLNREGGSRLMTETIAQAERVSQSRLIGAVIPLFWEGIGDWHG